VKPIHPKTEAMLERLRPAVAFLAKLEGIEFATARAKGMAAHYDEAFELYIDLARYLDVSIELKRLDKEIGQATKEAESARGALSNPAFVEKAPPEKVAEKRAQAEAAEVRIQKLNATRAELAEIAGAPKA
jgi:valyl-tRNA synthetase